METIASVNQTYVKSAELKEPGQLFRIRPDIVVWGPESAPKSAPKPDEAKQQMPEAVPTNWIRSISGRFRGVSTKIQNF